LEQARILERLGSTKVDSVGLLPLKPSPGPDSVREASQRLVDPGTRLNEAFFWFWPSGEPGIDPALRALADGDHVLARECWHAAGPISGISRHNLAVLDHVLALDLEQLPSPLDVGQAALRNRLWVGTMGHWKAVLEEEEFWDCLRGRIDAMNEPQLRGFDPKQLRAGLPEALLGINAHLAVRAAERGLASEAERHKRIMLGSGLDHDACRRALRKALLPIQERVGRLCRSAVSDARIENGRIAMELVARVLALPIDPDEREGLLDEIAEIQGKLCWFCLQRPGEASCAIRVWLHGDVTRATTSASREVRWRYVTIDVPQCRSCYEDHQTWEFRKMVGRIAPGIRPEAEKVAYPLIAKMMLDGWQMGSRPPGV